MDALRLSLLIFGALVIGGVYLWTSHVHHKKRQQRVGWEGPDSATISNLEMDNSDVSPDSQDYHFIPDNDHKPDVDKVFTQDIARESMSFNDTGEFRNLSNTIMEAKKEHDDVEVPSVFVKPKIYTSQLDQTKSHIKKVQEKERQINREKSAATGPSPGLVVVINVLARPGLEFSGVDIKHSLDHAGLIFGDMNIFHYKNDSPDTSKPLFSIANVVNPGTFDIASINDIKTPGLSMFMQVSGHVDALKVFEKMLSTAQNIKKELDGELCDESRSALTYQTISHLREQIKEYCFKYQQV